MSVDSKSSIWTSSVSIFIANMICAVYWPIDTLKVRKQAQMNESEFGRNQIGIFDSIKLFYKEEGFIGMYRGFYLQSVQSLAYSIFIYFQQSGKYRQRDQLNGNNYNYLMNFQINLESSFLSLCLMQPLWVLKTRIQLLNSSYKNPFQFIQENLVRNNLSIKELQSGFSVNLVLSVSGSVRFFIQDLLNYHFRKKDSKQEQYTIGLNAVIAKVIATTIFYPLEVLRTRIMDYNKENRGVFQNITTLIQENKLRNFYNGYGFNITKNIPIQLTMFLFYEKIKTQIEGKVN